MKIYRVIDDGTRKLTTANRLSALEMFYSLMQKHEQVQLWGWIDEEEVK